MYKRKYDIEEEENVHKKTICDYFTGPKKRKIDTALSWRKTQSLFIVDLGRSDIFQFYLHNGKFCNSVLHLKTAAVTMH